MKSCLELKESEYVQLTKLIESYDRYRNNILTFSFATVLMTFCLSLASEIDYSVWLYVVPYFVIIPFSGRYMYYRIASAHLISFLCVYDEKGTGFWGGLKYVPEAQSQSFKVIAILVNFEMLFLSVAVALMASIKYMTIYTSLRINGMLYTIYGFPFY